MSACCEKNVRGGSENATNLSRRSSARDQSKSTPRFSARDLRALCARSLRALREDVRGGSEKCNESNRGFPRETRYKDSAFVSARDRSIRYRRFSARDPSALCAKMFLAVA